ncbi:serine/threonine-protein kinase [Antrihabitans stalactiti]|uniref:non-specific serine/threonine protein kinase n=1 Tax=Antrihabitans stalactiti TaxID=2584121 RepID=A0A848KJ32_9NOCA|nr:serine/threonine-protein kinase [Antrihabitans stalactiti]NMN96230.1 serine/threonine protein kinase [Antrihabitans stalactiti]
MRVDAAIPAAIADYRILRLLGEGNHGRYYLAEAPERLGLATDRVALKVFAGQVSEDAYRRGVRELRAFAAVRSPHLVRIYDAVLEDNFLYAMEYFPMGSLASPARPLERREILRALADASRAVHELHEAGMVHGDIKPANVMVDDTGGKLSDLGLVRVLNSSNTVTSMAPATSVEFLDPELLYGETPSRASDVWALGATINRALTGEGLYGELPVGQPMLAIRAVHAGKARISPLLTPDEAALVELCLAPKGTRLRTAAAVADRIDALR